MNAKTEFHASDVADLGLSLVTQALDALQELTSAADGDIYTDAPECRSSINRVEDAIQQAYDVLMKVRAALHPNPGGESPEALVVRILDEAEEAFAIKSIVEERALIGGWHLPTKVQEYLFWIEDEAYCRSSHREKQNIDEAERHIYARALHNLVTELRGLGLQPTPPPGLVRLSVRESLPEVRWSP